MLVLIFALLTLAIVAALAMFWGKTKDSEEVKTESKVVDAECCGAHDDCEKELKKLDTNIVYFDDEELDLFSGKSNENYTDEAIEEFREVLYTLRKEEISDWIHSLELRNIMLPELLKSEVIMLLAE